MAYGIRTDGYAYWHTVIQYQNISWCDIFSIVQKTCQTWAYLYLSLAYLLHCFPIKTGCRKMKLSNSRSAEQCVIFSWQWHMTYDIWHMRYSNILIIINYYSNSSMSILCLCMPLTLWLAIHALCIWHMPTKAVVLTGLACLASVRDLTRALSGSQQRLTTAAHNSQKRLKKATTTIHCQAMP